jgi:hypothetical protein
MTNNAESRLDDHDPLAVWTERWLAALAAARKRGQKDTTVWGKGRVEIGPPAAEAELRQAEEASGVPIPDGLRRLFAMARSVEAVWHLGDVKAPPPLHEVLAGACIWSVDRIVARVDDYRGWITIAFPNAADPYGSVWHGKYPFLDAPNGDIVGIDSAGRVVYLSAEDGEGHGYVLGDNVFAFMDAWTQLGCPGPEDWQWMPFSRPGGGGLDPECANARAWRDWFGIR